jgi:hypothetical protein
MPAIFQIIGNIEPPPGVGRWISEYGGGNIPGLLPFATALLRLIITLAGLFAFFNLIIAGFQFMSAGGDPKAISKAWDKIWQSLIGLLIVAGSFVLAGIFGWLLFGNAMALLHPVIYGP